MNDLTPTRSPPLSVAYSANAELTVHLAKMLALVAPISMTTEQQELWLRGAVDALEDIRPNEVEAISAEVRRAVTRPSQIVPEIAKLVSEKRARSQRTSGPPNVFAAEMAINAKANEMRAAAKGDRRKLSDAFEYERQARIDAGLHVEPYPKPFSRAELETMPSHIRQMGLSAGFLVYRDGKLEEV